MHIITFFILKEPLFIIIWDTKEFILCAKESLKTLLGVKT